MSGIKILQSLKLLRIYHMYYSLYVVKVGRSSSLDAACQQVLGINIQFVSKLQCYVTSAVWLELGLRIAKDCISF
jgi:hypothetical protein